VLERLAVTLGVVELVAVLEGVAEGLLDRLAVTLGVLEGVGTEVIDAEVLLDQEATGVRDTAVLAEAIGARLLLGTKCASGPLSMGFSPHSNDPTGHQSSPSVLLKHTLFISSGC
jgi:hypothetical protein